MRTPMLRLASATAVAGVLLVGCGSGESADSAQSAKSKAEPAATAPAGDRIELMAATASEKTIERKCGFLKKGKYYFEITKNYAESRKADNAKRDGHAWVKAKYKDRSGTIRYTRWKDSNGTAKLSYGDIDHGHNILKSYHKGCKSCKEYTLTP